MKWLYITFGILGGLVPAAFLYVRTYTNAEGGVGVFDLGLVFLGVGLGFMAMPLGIAGGLLVAGVVHLSLNLLQRRQRLSAARSGQSDNRHGARQSWVTRDLGKQDPPTPTPGQEDISRHGSQPLRR